MNHPNRDTLITFDEHSIPTLDIVVLAALEMFQEKKPPTPEITTYTRPLVVGSGNAEVTGRILFEKSDAVFASESTYEAILKNNKSIDGVVLISASGGKDAPRIAQRAKSYGKPVTLLTATVGSEASKVLTLSYMDREYAFPKNREPYTYNTSTYMGMILGSSGEDPAQIERFIKEVVATLDFSRLGDFEKFFVIVPPQFSQIVRMIQIKFIELFGRKIARDVETSEYVRHATTVVHENELFISFGYNNTTWGKDSNRLNIPLPEWAGYATMMAVAYYVVGRIQSSHPPYFADNIISYTEEISKIFGETIHPIVE